jgi:hypothetical protein
MRTSVALISLALGLGSLGTLQAQDAQDTRTVKVELGPRLGIYFPSGPVVDEGPEAPGGRLRLQQVAAPIVGAQALAWPKPWLGIEASAVVSPSMVAVTDATGTADHTSTAVLASVRGIVPINSRRGMWSFNLGAGIGLVSRSGAVWQFQSGTTARTWVFSFGGQTALNPSVHMRFEFEDNLSTAQFDQGLPTATGSRPHHDFILAIAIEFPVVRR